MGRIPHLRSWDQTCVASSAPAVFKSINMATNKYTPLFPCGAVCVCLKLETKAGLDAWMCSLWFTCQTYVSTDTHTQRERESEGDNVLGDPVSWPLFSQSPNGCVFVEGRSVEAWGGQGCSLNIELQRNREAARKAEGTALIRQKSFIFNSPPKCNYRLFLRSEKKVPDFSNFPHCLFSLSLHVISLFPSPSVFLFAQSLSISL